MNPSLTADVKAVIDRLPHIISTFPVPNVFYRIAEELKSVFHFDRLSITLICEDKNSAVIEFLYSTNSDSHLPAGSVLPLNDSDLGEVLSTDNPVFVNDTSKGRCDTDALLLRMVYTPGHLCRCSMVVRLLGSVAWGAARPPIFQKAWYAFGRKLPLLFQWWRKVPVSRGN